MSRVDGLSFRSKPDLLQRHEQIQTHTYPLMRKEEQRIKKREKYSQSVTYNTKSLNFKGGGRRNPGGGAHQCGSPYMPWVREQFSKGPLLNCSMVVKFYKMYLMWKDNNSFYCQNSLAKSCQTLLHFTTMLKLSKGPQLNCCRVNITLVTHIALIVPENGGNAVQ